MKQVKRGLLCATLGSVLLAAPAAWADHDARLLAAQKAYAEVDYEGTRRLASAAIEQGGNDRASTAQLYLLWGTAAAALDQADEARTAFVYALALNPDTRLERSLSPKIRAPYLEARGSLSLADGKPPLELTLERRGGELELRLRDAAHLVASIELSTRASGRDQFVHQHFDASPSRRVPAPAGTELQFFLQALDRHGNVLFAQGSADEPGRLALNAPQPAPERLRTGSADVNRTPYYVTAGALAALGLASGGLATAFYLRREDAAREWNGSGCERPGMTRQEQCGNVESRRQRAEYLSIGFAAASGGLLVGSLITLLVAPTSPSRTDLALDATPDRLMLRLRTSL